MIRRLRLVVALVLALAMPAVAAAQPRPTSPEPSDDAAEAEPDEGGEAGEEKAGENEDGESETGESDAGESDAGEPAPGERDGDAATTRDGGKAEPPGASEPDYGSPDPKSACLGSFGRAQRMRREAMLLEARQELLACAQDGCFDAVRVKCLQWLDEVDADIPTLVIAIKDKRGETPPDARVLIDGGGASAALGGRALEVNPGTHEMSVTLGSGERMVKTVTILQGQKNQSVVFDFTPPEEPTNTLPPQVIVRGSSTNVPAIIAFGVGGAALAAGIITGALALKDGDDLEEQCDQVGCDADDLGDHTLAHVSTGTFVLAGVSAALGLTFLFVLDDDDEPRPGVALSVGPTSTSLRVDF